MHMVKAQDLTPPSLHPMTPPSVHHTHSIPTPTTHASPLLHHSPLTHHSLTTRSPLTTLPLTHPHLHSPTQLNGVAWKKVAPYALKCRAAVRKPPPQELRRRSSAGGSGSGAAGGPARMSDDLDDHIGVAGVGVGESQECPSSVTKMQDEGVVGWWGGIWGRGWGPFGPPTRKSTDQTTRCAHATAQSWMGRAVARRAAQ